MSDDRPVTVEFFGIPRQRAGCAAAALPAGTVAELLAALEATFPGLRGLRRPDGRLAPHYLLSLDGGRFVTDPAESLRPGDKVLLLTADVGG